MRSIESRLSTLEQAAREIKTASPKTPCICPFGERSVYFIVEGMTEAEAAKRYPDNRKHCRRCGGLNIAVNVDATDMDV